MRPLFLILLIFPLQLFGQFEITHFNDQTGLKSNRLSTIISDEDGFIWFINSGELVRFDGTNFDYFKVPQTSRGIFTFFESTINFHNYRIAVSADSKLHYFDETGFHSYTYPDSLELANIDSTLKLSDIYSPFHMDKYGQMLFSEHFVMTPDQGVVDLSPTLNGASLKYNKYLESYYFIQNDTIRILDEKGSFRGRSALSKLPKKTEVARSGTRQLKTLYKTADKRSLVI